MNLSGSHEVVPGVKTCWDVFAPHAEGQKTSAVAALAVLLVIASLNLGSNVWCAFVMFATPKLRKSTWLLKGSMAIKDVILTIAMVSYGLWNVTPVLSGRLPSQAEIDSKSNIVNPIVFVFNVVYVTCLAASFMHILVICLDRHQVISRPFRYHTGDLLPPKIAGVLVASVWTVCFVIGLSVTSESLETSERLGTLRTNGVLLPVYQMPGVQKWLLGGGMLIVYSITIGLLCTALQIEFKRARTRKEELLSGIGAPEPLRSRNNSVCHSNKNKALYGGARDSMANSESDANEFLLSGGGGFAFNGKDFAGFRPLSKPWQTVAQDEATFFTPVHYRPSLLRRIRDTWSLYSAAMCFVAFTLTTVIPFVAMFLANRTDGGTEHFRKKAKTQTFCIGSMVTEYLFLLQGICYVTLYLITDDVFRPFYTKPLRLIRCQTKDDSQLDAAEDRNSQRCRRNSEMIEEIG